MSTKKQIEFEIEGRTYRVNERLNNTYDVHGFNDLREQVGVYKDLISGERIFVIWGLIPVIRFTDAADKKSKHKEQNEPEDHGNEDDEDDL